MSDEPTTPATDTVDEGAEGAVESQVDFEKRYNDLRPEFDRTKQQLSEYETAATNWSRLSDPQTRAEVLAELGLDFVEDDEDDDTSEYDDPIETLAAEVAALKADRQAEADYAKQEAAQEAKADYILSELTKIETQIDRELDEDERHLIALRAQALEDDRGTPNVTKAWESLNGVYERRQKEWIGTKQGVRAPGGRSASKQPDLSNERERADYIDSRLAANE